ncbi:hypothetical protein D8771_14825 [Streptomyces albus]|uniref:Uncharacterized protein n=1 Tax=Streptomyces albus TaxID=1888 RepID=A0A8H1QS19_9ACTN|nr:hypothetical protein D8771_14825 [Streptomyces albus]
MRGWSQCGSTGMPCRAVLPAYAGMVPRSTTYRRTRRGALRACHRTVPRAGEARHRDHFNASVRRAGFSPVAAPTASPDGARTQPAAVGGFIGRLCQPSDSSCISGFHAATADSTASGSRGKHHA